MTELITRGGSGQLTTTTVAATEACGEAFGRVLEAGDVVILDGPLGAGKTAFTRGIAAGLGVSGQVSSPTFVIARQHRAGDRGVGLVHVDAYRLFGPEGPGGRSAAGIDLLDELEALDMDAELDDAAVVIEWGAGLAERLSETHVVIRLQRELLPVDSTAGEDEPRQISWQWFGV